MPEASKVRWPQLKVGLIAIAALLILFVLVFLLTSTRGVFQHNVALRTYMDDAAALPDGAPVRLNGITVGYLDKLRLTGSRNTARAVEFNMLVQEKYLKDIPVDSMASITAANLIGDKFINITRGQDARHVEAGGEIPSF